MVYAGKAGHGDDRWRGRSVFVTGADGFIGSWLAGALVDAGAQVVALSRDELPRGGLRLQGIEQKVVRVRGDLADLALLRRVLTEYDVTACFHLAAQSLVGVAERSPLATFATNAMGTATLLEACRQANVREVMLASSDKAYGASPDLPYREDTPLRGTSTYEASKVAAEVIARSYAASSGMRIAVARCANVYGGGDLNFSRLIPDTIRAVLSDRDPVLRSDGTPRRDYVYASDAASAYLALGAHCAERMSDGSLEAFNFGWGVPVSALEVVELIIELSGKRGLRPNIAGAGKASHEIKDQYLDSTLARTTLGWEPEVDLRTGLRNTVEWYGTHGP